MAGQSYILSAGRSLTFICTRQTPAGQPWCAMQGDHLRRGSASFHTVSPYFYSSKTFQVLLTVFVTLFLMPIRTYLATHTWEPYPGAGYSHTLPYLVIWTWLCRGHSCWHSGFSSLLQKAPYGRCGLLKFPNFLSTLASAKLLIQVLVSILKSWFPQVNWNWFRGNPLSILNALKKISSIALLLLCYTVLYIYTVLPIMTINSVFAIQQ